MRALWRRLGAPDWRDLIVIGGLGLLGYGIRQWWSTDAAAVVLGAVLVTPD